MPSARKPAQTCVSCLVPCLPKAYTNLPLLLCALSVPEAALSLGMYMHNGLGEVTRDEEESRRWLSLADARGCEKAAFILGQSFEHREPRDLLEAKQWYTKAASRGNNARACRHLGLLLSSTDSGVFRSERDSIRWLVWVFFGSPTHTYHKTGSHIIDHTSFSGRCRFERAVSLGDDQSMFHLALMFQLVTFTHPMRALRRCLAHSHSTTRRPVGMISLCSQQNRKKYVSLLRRAAAAGEPRAQFNLAQHLMTSSASSNGAVRVEIAGLLHSASSQGDVRAARTLRRLNAERDFWAHQEAAVGAASDDGPS